MSVSTEDVASVRPRLDPSKSSGPQSGGTEHPTNILRRFPHLQASNRSQSSPQLARFIPSAGAMSSFRTHRIVIASLFLPNTAVLGPDPSEATTPIGSILDAPLSSPPISVAGTKADGMNRLLSRATSPQPLTQGGRTAFPLPITSIIDDLVKSTPITPTQESMNPFGDVNLVHPLQLAALSVSESYTTAKKLPDTSQSPLPLSRKHHTTHTDHAHPSHRVARKSTSRSSSRRPTMERDSSANSINSGIVEQWHIGANPHCNGGLHNAVNSIGVGDRLKKLWVGVLGGPTDHYDEDLRKDIDTKMRKEVDSLAVWIPDSEFSKCYDEFCHQVLWPCLHYAIPDAPKTKSFYESASYKQYVDVNQKFADVIIANYEDGDIIWVNDYHLMLLPDMVRAALPNAAIGFFLHVAFPSSEIFRCLTVRQQLLRGMLASDLIGFQTANYARHFRQTCSRILSLEALPKGIQTDERFVDVAVFPMGIDVASLTNKRQDPEVADWVELLKQRYAGLKMIVGRDKLDEVQGMRLKIHAFETFLEKFPEHQGKVVLIQVALSTTEENETQGRVTDAVARVNSRFSTLTYQPIVFLPTPDLTFSQYLGLLTAADAFLVTSLREGMALRTHEFVECQEGQYGPLILSEFTGSYSYSGFRSCLPINPWDSRMTANAINLALTMDPSEAQSRWQDLHNHVITQTAQKFVTSFLTRCLRVHVEHQQQTEPSTDVSPLDISRVLPQFRHSRKRLLLIDLEGCLWIRDSDPRIRMTETPPKEVVDVLLKVTEDSRNEVWILSGLQMKGVLETLGKAVPRLGICAENGCFVKPRPVNNKQQGWINMITNFNLSWKPACMEILNYFMERTPGSFIEEREASVVWRFWTGPGDDSSGRQWARRQAAEAQNHIFDSLGERYGLRIIPGKNSFLVLPSNISRSSAVGSILSPGGPANSVLTLPANPIWSLGPDLDRPEVDSDHDDGEFLMAISADEKLLRRLNELGYAETVSTSDEGTDARYKLPATEVISILREFAKAR